MRVATVVLAAGRSRRFGTQNKLLASCNGRPLAVHAAECLRQLSVDHRAVITSDDDVAALFLGFDIINAPDDTRQQSDSLNLAVAYAIRQQADYLLILLADMPLVTVDICQSVMDLVTDDQAAAVSDGNRRMPPACFPASQFAALQALEGDKGAGVLLKPLPETALVKVPPAILQDIDTPDMLAALNADI